MYSFSDVYKKMTIEGQFPEGDRLYNIQCVPRTHARAHTHTHTRLQLQ